jgi:hypothetical protein
MFCELLEILNNEKKYFYCYIFTIEKMQIITFPSSSHGAGSAETGEGGV